MLVILLLLFGMFGILAMLVFLGLWDLLFGWGYGGV